MTAKHTPGPWWCDTNGLSIWANNAKIGGSAKILDIRGWGYLTGHGHGALGLPEAEAIEIQMANGRLAAAAPDLLAAAQDGLASMVTLLGLCRFLSPSLRDKVNDEVAKLEARIAATRTAITRATGGV